MIEKETVSYTRNCQYENQVSDRWMIREKTCDWIKLHFEQTIHLGQS